MRAIIKKMSANGNQVRSGSVVVSTETLSTSNSAPEPVTVVDVCGTAKQGKFHQVLMLFD